MTYFAILDFGSQYTPVIGRRIRELGQNSKILNYYTLDADLEDALGIILSGGPKSVYDSNSPRCDRGIWELEIPKLAICYSFQLYAHTNGGKVTSAKSKKEYSKADLIVDENCSFFDKLPEKQVVWMSHGDKITKLPYRMVPLAHTQDCEYAVAADPKNKVIGVQFHPEVDNTEYGKEMLFNFMKLCKG
jgi:GMP synthase (glutamine-hydrolysing)